jgi:hemerythrin superfamily protein
MKTLEEADNEEAYWFVRWVKLRAEVRRMKQAFEEIKGSEMSVLRAENLQLKNTISQIRKNFVPETPKRKRIYKGNNPNKKL